jgi:hypothetical protein
MAYLRLAIACPACGWVPPNRPTHDHVQVMRALDPGVIVDSFKCQNKRCKAIYPVPAKAYQQASAA